MGLGRFPAAEINRRFFRGLYDVFHDWVVGTKYLMIMDLGGPAAEYAIKRLDELEHLDIRRQLRTSQASLFRMLDRLDALQFASHASEKALNDIRTEYHRFKELAAIEESKARAILKEVDTTLEKNAPRERRWSLWLEILANGFFFILGVVAQDPLKAWWDSIWNYFAKG